MIEMLETLVPRSFKRYMRMASQLRNRLRSLDTRVHCLEAMLDAMVISPRYNPADNRSFNGQHLRRQIFRDVIAACGIQTIVETGTSLGETTGFMAETSRVPVYSSEISQRSHMMANSRLAAVNGVNLELTDSRRFLERLATLDLPQPVFFYLDAHWYTDLPLRGEIELIARHWDRCVIMIDDFKVPHDSGYGYDEYGRNRCLEIGYIQDQLTENNLGALFPAAAAVNESGAKRGCVVIGRHGELYDRLAQVAGLTPARTARPRRAV